MKVLLSFVVAGICLLPNNQPIKVKKELPAIQQTSRDVFTNDEILEIKLSGPLRELFDDRREVPSYYPVEISYRENDSSEVKIPIRARTRGHFRRIKGNCDYPPILLNFEKSNNSSTLFQNQHKVKLVTPCQDENYVFREWLVYKMYNLLTPESLRARLVRIVCHDNKRKKELPSFYGILLEDSKAMASRNNMMELEKKIPAEYTDKESFLKMALFQYMIGNCDWSIRYLHNTKLIAADSFDIPHVVPYDFDHAGIVEAHYAHPPEELGLRSTRERRYRGYCFSDTKMINQVLAIFQHHKNDFYKLYTTCPYLSTKYIRSTTRFLDDFYKTIEDPKQLTAAISGPCRSDYVDVIVKGLREE